jgi:hypothetical protein
MDDVDKMIDLLIIIIMISSAIKCVFTFIAFGFEINWDFKSLYDCTVTSASVLECYNIKRGVNNG